MVLSKFIQTVDPQVVLLMWLYKEKDLLTRKETLQDADSDHQLITLLLMHKSYVSFIFANFLLAYERMVCKSP